MHLDALFEPLTLSPSLRLKNRIVMAPMTRCMADDSLCATEDMARYYARRASTGLIITEATIVDPGGQGYPNTPGIFSEAQQYSWQKVCDAVHAEDGCIFLQLWHVGRVSHPVFHDGELPVAPSAVPLSGKVNRMPGLEYGTPRELAQDEILSLIEAYGNAARRAREAGFDGVEIHGANGYLIDQFLRQHTNRRDDAFGGDAERRCRFALDVIESVCSNWSSERVGIRLSPAAYFHNEYTEGDNDSYQMLLEHPSVKALAYVHTGIFDDSVSYDYLGARASDWLRAHYTGNLIACGSYTIETAVQSLEQGNANAVAFGRPLIANPDFVQKVSSGEQLLAYDESQLKSLE